MGTDSDFSSSSAAALLAACPFLKEHRTDDWDIGGTIIFGDVATLLRSKTLSDDETQRVFKCFDELAESGDARVVDALATGAIEMFNDDAESQRLARRYLRGRGLDLLEQMRECWGQPDYGADE